MSEKYNTNINSIEEAIKQLEDLKKDRLSFVTGDKEHDEIYLKDVQAIEIVLGNLEALCDMQRTADRELENAKKINEEHKKENGLLREKVKELEEERQIVGMPVKNKRNGNIGVVLHQWKSGSVAVLENINPRVINTHDSWNTLEIITDEIKQIQTKNDNIPKQKIKDKIEEIKQIRRELGFKTYLKREDMINEDREIVIRIKVLEGLLQEGEDI